MLSLPPSSPDRFTAAMELAASVLLVFLAALAGGALLGAPQPVVVAGAVALAHAGVALWRWRRARATGRPVERAIERTVDRRTADAPSAG